MASNSKHIAELLNTDTTVTTTDLADDSVSSAKLNTKLTVGGNINFSAISQTKADTAVDVFVYDTKKDSDGGAWRKRTQSTSWYNETLNTATRGSRKEFPAVAVIVAQSNIVTIYDGDEHDLPMWMVFNFSNYQAVASTMTSIVMMNGHMCCGGGANGFGLVNFLTDSSSFITTAIWNNVIGNISTRNVSNTGWGGQYSSQRIVHANTHDVDITVLPNAPIDSYTGLPIPTIAVATNAGVSVIKDNGTIIDITVNNSSYTSAHEVEFFDDYSLGCTIGTSNQIGGDHFYVFHKIPSSDNVITVDNISGTVMNADELYAVQANNSNVDLILNGPDSNRKINDVSKHAVGTDSGLSIISRSENGDPHRAMCAYVGSDYNTGWQVGDTKLAALSSTSNTNATSADGNLVSNGTFASATTGWTAHTSAIAISSGTLQVTPNSGVNGSAYQSLTTVALRQYTLTATVTQDSGSLSRIYVGTSTDLTNSASYNLVTNVNLGVGTYAYTFTATGTTTVVHLVVGGGSGQATKFDNVSVTEAEEDRSANPLPLAVFGNIVKSYVATSADLVGYSNFSSANYLYHNYNTAIDFAATDDMSFILWFKKTGTTVECFFSLGDDSVNGKERAVFIQADGKVKFVDSGTSTESSAVRTGLDEGKWHCLVVCVDSGNKQRIYIDGKLDHNGVLTLLDLPTNTELYIGKRGNDTLHATNSSFALFRISSQCPTEAQVLKIYNDERHLFETGANSTLHGASNAVTAVGYDSDTHLLHVGTSAGLSTFNGLERVENTTNAVGATIHASNGMVVED